MNKDQRGFSVYTEFEDTYSSKVVIKESSSIEKRCWIFVTNDGKGGGGHNLATDGAIHIDVDQAKEIRKALKKFINSN